MLADPSLEGEETCHIPIFGRFNGVAFASINRGTYVYQDAAVDSGEKKGSFMSLPKFVIFVALALFGTIAMLTLLKSQKNEASQKTEIALGQPVVLELPPVEPPASEPTLAKPPQETPKKPQEEAKKLQEAAKNPQGPSKKSQEQAAACEGDLPDADRIAEFFNTREPKLSIVQTVTYKSSVPWLSGRPAWIADYATHFKTSRHFIARSLNGKCDYEKQDVADGDRFNVLSDDKNFEFYLLIDTLTSKLWFYYYDPDSGERVLVKTYKVGLGRPDESAESGTLTPLGRFTLGSKIAVYRPKTMAYHHGEKTEMVRVFGTRWIPLGEEVSGCTAPAKGYGIHGLPLHPDENGELVEDLDSLGRYESDGCIRLATKDVEELFAIVITRPTTVEIVKGFHNATAPGQEKKG